MAAEGDGERGGRESRSVVLRRDVRWHPRQRRGRRSWSWPAESGELRSSFAGGCCLCGTLLELPGLCDRLDQGGELQDEMGEDAHKVRRATASPSDFGVSQGSGNRAKVSLDSSAVPGG